MACTYIVIVLNHIISGSQILYDFWFTNNIKSTICVVKCFTSLFVRWSTIWAEIVLACTELLY